LVEFLSRFSRQEAQAFRRREMERGDRYIVTGTRTDASATGHV
jgi:hypothetical protein